MVGSAAPRVVVQAVPELPGAAIVRARFDVPGWSWLEQALVSLRSVDSLAPISLRWSASEADADPGAGQGPGSDPGGAGPVALGLSLTLSFDQEYQSTGGGRAAASVYARVTISPVASPVGRADTRGNSGAATSAIAALAGWRRIIPPPDPHASTLDRRFEDTGVDETARAILRVLRSLDRYLPGRALELEIGPAQQRRADALGSLLRERLGIDEGDANPGRTARSGPVDPARRRAEATAALDATVGMREFKEFAGSLLAQEALEARRRDAGLGPAEGPGHLVFVGNSGTGRSTAAGILAGLLAGTGDGRFTGSLVRADRATLVSGYVGQTAGRVAEVVERARGGVLLVEHAETLVGPDPRDFGYEALAALVSAAERARGDLVLVVETTAAGWRELQRARPGLPGVIGTVVRFPDLRPAESAELVAGMLAAAGYEVDPGVLALLPDLPVLLGPDSGSGHSARRLADTIRARQATRVSADDTAGLQRITLADLPQAPGALVDPVALAAARAELDALVGMVEVKLRIGELVDYAEVAAERRALGLVAPARSNHVVLVGRPGTGKTTVARLLGRLLAGLGTLTSGHVHEVRAEDLMAEHEGGTAPRTRRAVEAAIGGVLFIDEAYVLARGRFADEAVTALLEAMETHRDDLVIVVAGYAELMDEFLELNQGLASRLPNRFLLPDLTATQSAEVFARYAAAAGLVLEDPADVRDRVAALVTPVLGRPGWANGRTVRTMFEQSLVIQARRLASDGQLARMTGIDLDPADRARSLLRLLPADIASPEVGPAS